MQFYNNLYRKIRYLIPALAMIFMISCQPEHVKPSDSTTPQSAALEGNETNHKEPFPKCGNEIFTDLEANINGQWVSLGEIQMVNEPDSMNFVYLPDPPMVVTKAAIWRGPISSDCNGSDPECQVPKDASGNPDPTQFQWYRDLAIGIAPYEFRINLPELYEENQFVVWANLKVTTSDGSVIFQEEVFAEGKEISAGAQSVDYVMNTCPFQTCEPWIDGNPPCGCKVPQTYLPGDDLSEFGCGNGKGSQKVTVCHLPPGNPENMQEICISTNALPAHIKAWKPVSNPCKGHNSGCHLGECDPCGEGSSLDYAKDNSGC